MRSLRSSHRNSPRYNLADLPIRCSSLRLVQVHGEPTRIPSTSAEFISMLSQASRLNLPAKIDRRRSLDDLYFFQLLAKIFDQELVVLINWAKAIPGISTFSCCSSLPSILSSRLHGKSHAGPASDDHRAELAGYPSARHRRTLTRTQRRCLALCT